MLRPPGVTNQTGRISIKERPLTSDQAFLEHVQAMRDGMRTTVDQVITCQPTHVIMGVALEAFWGGVAAADELQRELADRAGVGVSMGSTATVAALQRFGAKSIAVLTPHQPRGDEQVRRYFEEAGFSIKRLIGLKCPSPVQIAHTTRQQVVDSLHTLNGDDVDALVQVGTNLAAIGVCAEAERSFGKPVLAINAITYWDALRRCGIEDRIQGYGRTLEEF
jgi:maleate isomerase